MNTLIVQNPGMFTTVQDRGRPGFAHLGVAQGGAFDTLSMTICNRLVGNADDAAGLEITLIGPTIRFRAPAIVCASDICAIQGPQARTINAFEVFELGAEATLTLPRTSCGPRAFMSIAGGVQTPLLMGSASTHVTGGFGGHQGRALRAGDELTIGPRPAAPPITLAPGAMDALRALLAPRPLAAIPTPDPDHFPPGAIDEFFRSTFTLSQRCDRVGLQLQGHTIATSTGGRLISRGMSPGAIQVPEGGLPIMLGVDHPTTGGYPVIATVASAHLDALARLAPGQSVTFTPITPAQGRALWLQRQQNLDRIVLRR